MFEPLDQNQVPPTPRKVAKRKQTRTGQSKTGKGIRRTKANRSSSVRGANRLAANQQADQKIRSHALKVSALMGVCFYGVLIATSFSADSQEVFRDAFGPQPFGVPVAFVVVAVQTLLYFPIPFFMYQGVLVSSYFEAKGGFVRGPFSALHAVFSIFGDGSKQAIAVVLTFVGLAYFATIVGCWIWYANSIGI